MQFELRPRAESSSGRVLRRKRSGNSEGNGCASASGYRPTLALALRSRCSLHRQREPTVQTARDGVALYRKEGCDFVVAVGGGSVIDAGRRLRHS